MCTLLNLHKLEQIGTLYIHISLYFLLTFFAWLSNKICSSKAVCLMCQFCKKNIWISFQGTMSAKDKMLLPDTNQIGKTWTINMGHRSVFDNLLYFLLNNSKSELKGGSLKHTDKHDDIILRYHVLWGNKIIYIRHNHASVLR